MRVNVYSQEIDLDTHPEIVTTRGKNAEGMEETFIGIRFMLHSSERLHDSLIDDDRSAVTFWLPKSEANRVKLAHLFGEAYYRTLNVLP